MKHVLLTLAILFLVLIKVFSQNDFRDGYIIKNNNDTVFGLLDYKGDKANARKCIFKKDINAEKQTFSPLEVKAYRFNDSKYYISKAVEINDKTDTLFLEYLINGIIDIYYFRDDEDDHYLIETEDNKLVWLTNEEKEILKENSKYVVNSKRYVGVLKYIFSKSASVTGKVDNIELKHEPLIKIANMYHNDVCSGDECIIYEKKLTKASTSVGFLIGMNNISCASLSSSNDPQDYLSDIQSDYYTYPSVGIFIKKNLPNVNERLFFQYECTFSRRTIKMNSLLLEREYNRVYTNSISIVQSSLNNSGIVKYNILCRKFRPFIQIGCFANYSFAIDYSRDLTIKWSWGDIAYYGKYDKYIFSKVDAGLILGFGSTMMIYKKEVFVDFKYQAGIVLLPSILTNNLSLNIGIQLGK